MADPYLPPQPGSYDPGRNPRDPAQTSNPGQTRVTNNISSEPNRQIPVSDDRRGGFSTGIMVALVFVVVAILAAVLYSGSDGTATNGTDGSTTTIENNNADTAPSAPADAPATVPDSTAPDAAAPDATSPDAATPDATAPDATAPDATAPDATAPAEPAPAD